MTTYVYETIPQKAGEEPRRFEVKQSMREAPLTTHPETGEPVRRVVLGGFGILSGPKPKPSAPKKSGGHSCGGGCCCHH